MAFLTAEVSSESEATADALAAFMSVTVVCSVVTADELSLTACCCAVAAACAFSAAAWASAVA